MASLRLLQPFRTTFTKAVLAKPRRAPFAVQRPRHFAVPCRSSARLDAPSRTADLKIDFQKEKKWVGRSPHSAGVAVLSTVGRHNGHLKEFNQDAFVVEHIHEKGHQATLIGVFDGHGTEGHHAAQHVSRQVATTVHQCARQALQAKTRAERSLWWDYDYAAPGSNLGSATILSANATGVDFDQESAQACLEHTFNLTAESVTKAKIDLYKSGSTAVVCMVLPDSVVSAHCGDSRAVVGTAQGSGTYTVTQLTQDHKPNKLSEMARILSVGGRVTRTSFDKNGHPIGPFRVSLPTNRASPGLAVSRGFGDLQLACAGVVPTPDLAVFPRSATACHYQQRPSEVLIVASDGLWEVISNEEAVSIAAAAPTPEMATELLVREAKERWAQLFGARHADDVTVAVAFL